MRIRRCAVAVVAAAALLNAGCATAPSEYRPLIDTKNVDAAQLEQDLAECRAYAHQSADAAAGAAVGAAFGAVLMGLTAAALGGNSRDIGQWAGAGAVVGGAQGAAAGATTQIDIIRNCMAGRGYKVLALNKRDAGADRASQSKEVIS